MQKVNIIKIFAGLMIIIYLVQLIIILCYIAPKKMVPSGWDFVQHYSASMLATQGQASSAYNFDKLSLVESSIAGFKVELHPYYLMWNYPPSFLLLIMPLSLLPYKVSLILWVFIFFIAYILVLYQIAPNPLTIWLAIAFPANFWNVLHCQNGFFFGCLLGAGLFLLYKKPPLSGILLGLFTCKPHLAFIIPLALIAGRQWKALSSMAIIVLLMFISSSMLFTFKVWDAFMSNAQFVRLIMENGSAPWHKNLSIFATTRLLSASIHTAYLLQIILAIIVIGVTCYVWWRCREPVILNSILVLGILLATPYLMVNDLTLLAIPLAYFIWQNYDKNIKLYELIVISLVWGLPLYSPSALLTHVQIAPFILITFMAIILFRALNFGMIEKFVRSLRPK
jgi:hypothetical protein